MTENPQISVILPNYNHASFIEQSINSILNQTYENLELIIVDDKSTDNSVEVIQGLRDKLSSQEISFPVKAMFLDENKGKWNALNLGIATATGKLISIQDADDVACPQKLERQLACLKQHGSFHNLCGFYHCYTQDDINKYKDSKIEGPVTSMGHKEVLQLVYKGHLTPGINHFYTGNFEVHGGSPLFYKQLWENGMKFLPGNMGLRIQKAEDSDHNTKMTLLLQKTSVLKEKLYCYRRNTATNPAYLEDL